MATPTPLPKTMKQWVQTRNGAPKDALQLKTDAAVPSAPAPSSADVLIKISHAALNPVDVHHMRILPTWLPFRRCPTPGFDFCGEVVAAGSAAPEEFRKVGAVVGGALGGMQVAFGKGTLAEYVTMPAHLLALKPKGLSEAEAAGVLGIAGQTANICVRAAGVEQGQRGLVNGASGGVGSLLVQILKAKGVVVYGVCSGVNEAMVKGLGVDEVIDYKAHDPVEPFLAEKFKDQPLDFIIDCVGSQPLFSHSTGYLKPKGKFLTIAGGKSNGVVPFVRNRLRPVMLGGTPRSWQILALLPAGNLAQEVAAFVDDGSIKKPLVDEVFPFEEAVKAFEKLATGRAKGKIVVKVAV
ncbi:hypothetical protein B0H63DRAFT_565032 [Podospora didyma]|uniref:Enoyl reductase (ER) domain-containing protein n=1 Tax=Podospora didyma TaxID=330526 RepID=A0AAE0K1H4_9PEZI|nr:hypothetical protein B0H63DRAFT_565032 [Podospora didyma]